jgi:hypothetical protein
MANVRRARHHAAAERPSCWEGASLPVLLPPAAPRGGRTLVAQCFPVPREGAHTPGTTAPCQQMRTRAHTHASRPSNHAP